jgi:hypothetical protein
MLRALSKEGWRSKYAKKVDFAAIMGQSFAAGVGVYNNLRLEHEKSGTSMPPRTTVARGALVDACWDVAERVMATRKQNIVDLGLIVDSSDEQGYVSKMEERVRKALTSYIVTDPIPDTSKILAVELEMGEEYGNCRPDLIVEDSLGLCVVDYKTKLLLKAEYRQKTIQEYANKHQMLHYGWATRSYFTRSVPTYAIGLAIFEPRFDFGLIPFPLNDETLKIWEQGTKVAWGAMEREEAGEVPPWLSDTHQDNFGQCVFYKACFTHHYDPALMAQDYILVEKVND